MRDANGEYHYVPRGSVRKPCPACGETKIFKRDSICQECAGDLRLARRIKETQAKQAAEDRQIVMIPADAHRMPYLSHAYGRREYGEDARRRILAPLCALAHSASEHAGAGGYDSPKLFTESERHFDGSYRMMRVSDIELFRQLFADIKLALKMAHADGVHEGRNLLLSLADGSITTNEFNERAARMMDGAK